jgi:hypothetical protein
VVPSVIALLECREARAREELESWLETLREAEQHAAAARQRVDHARIAREEVLRALAGEGEGVARRAEIGPRTSSMRAKADGSPPVPAAGPAGTVAAVQVPVALRQPAPAGPGGGADYDQRPPQWRAGLGEDVLSGVYRQVFAAAAAAPGPVTAQELTRALGRDAERMNSGLWRGRPVGSPLRPVQALPRHPPGQGEQAGPPHHLLVVVGTAFVVAVESAGA